MSNKPTEKRVTVSMTERDVENTNRVRELLHTRTNSGAVSDALSLTATLAGIVKEGNELLIRNKKGEIERLVITGLD